MKLTLTLHVVHVKKAEEWINQNGFSRLIDSWNDNDSVQNCPVSLCIPEEVHRMNQM